MRHETATKSSLVPVERGPSLARERAAGFSRSLILPLTRVLAAWAALWLTSGSALAEPAPAPASADPAAMVVLDRAPHGELPISQTTALEALLALSSKDASPADELGLRLRDLEDEAALADLLAVPGLSQMLSEAQTADRAIALAVERGTNPDLEPKKPFRKRNVDLFRTERPVEIGRQEMILRLRLRAKLKRAISVQLKF